MRGRQKRISRNSSAVRQPCFVCGTDRETVRTRIYDVERTVCDSCLRMPVTEIEYQAALAELSRCRTWDGFVPRKQRKRLTALLRHRNLDIVKLAKEIESEDGWQRRMSELRKNRDFGPLDEMELAFSQWQDERETRLPPALADFFGR